MRLYLVRHGQTVWNATNRAQGHTDVDLDDVGRAQAGALADRLAGNGVRRVLSSDLKRARQTLEPFLRRQPVEVEYTPALRERTFGDMEGEDYTRLHEWMAGEGQRLSLRPWEVRPPGGESLADVWERLDAVVATLGSEAEDTLVVSHGGTLAQLLARLVRGTLETPRAFRFANCGLTVLGKRPDGTYLLEAFNDREHLEAASGLVPTA